MPKHFSQAEVDSKGALETLCKLAPHGFGDAEFELVHHWRAKGKLTGFKNHCERLIKRKDLFRPGDNNHLLHLRLLSILQLCNRLPPGKKNFNSLAEEAMTAHPPIEKNAK
ncbi:MAG: hypothetical protein ABR928_00085 [Terracidiphilus sp.]|jgi:hypothetical protein